MPSSSRSSALCRLVARLHPCAGLVGGGIAPVMLASLLQIYETYWAVVAYTAVALLVPTGFASFDLTAPAIARRNLPNLAVVATGRRAAKQE